ncbi:aquaporin-like protein [Lojkania enalia]|uniref:Aquaporin-like protein n=1 Tax=Lojkania enalia TaxID=147567 RepID=A0A9P4KGV8_9PLEO|nr:aquaporin-like protein [Didymosphaeria enalia]
MSGPEHLERLEAQNLELGATDAVQHHVTRKIVQPGPASERELEFEHPRPRWLREMMAEATGVFFYMYPGIASTAAFFPNNTEPAFGSLFQIAWIFYAYATGIAFAIMTCAPTSGGHFNPAIALCFAFWEGFQWRKVLYYIFAQNNLGYLFLIEFFVDSFTGVVIWASHDPANPFISPASGPFVIGLAYGNMVWGFADISISTNPARDPGTRIVATIWFGGEAFSYEDYSWIAILVNVPATFFATAYYEMLMRDSLKKIGHGNAVHADGEEGLMKHLSKKGWVMENGASNV